VYGKKEGAPQVWEGALNFGLFRSCAAGIGQPPATKNHVPVYVKSEVRDP
jgi:hypothetical protein